MNLPKAIIDTSALICLYYLELLSYLKLLYTEVRVPRAVEKEFLENPASEIDKTTRFAFLSDFYLENNSWFIPCNEYGGDLVELYLLLPDMNRGEAEALAQNQFFDNFYEVILDEKIARQLAQSKNMDIHGTLYLLAKMDIQFQICNYFIVVERLKVEQNTFFSKAVIKKAYEIVKREILG